MVLARLVLIGGKGPAQGCLDDEDIEIVRRHARTPQLDRFVSTGQGDGSAGLRGHVLEDAVVFLPVQVIQRGDTVDPTSWRLLQHAHNAVRLCIRERFQQDRVDEAENRRIRADSDGQCQQRDDGEARALEESPKAVAQILAKFVHGGVVLLGGRPGA